MTVALAEACSALRGANFPAGAARYVAEKGLVPCLTTSAIQDNVDWTTVRFVPRERLGRSWTALQKDDILVSTANSLALVGKSARVKTVDGEYAFGAFVTVLRPHPGVESRYLSYFLRAPETRAAMFARSSQTTNISNLRVADLLQLELPLPPLPEQRRIADRLDTAMMEVAAARAAVERQANELDALYYARINDALGGPAIAAVGDHGSDEEGWVPLGSVAKLESGHTPSRKRPEWWGGDVHWIALPDIRAFDGGTAFATSERTNELGLAHSSARLLPAGTVVMSRTASVGFVTVMGIPMATSQDFVNWVPGPNLRSWYLAYALIGARDYLRRLSSGAIHKTIYMPTLKGLKIRLPPLHQQDRALARIQDAGELVGAAGVAVSQQADNLEALPPVLLTAAFRGEF